MSELFTLTGYWTIGSTGFLAIGLYAFPPPAQPTGAVSVAAIASIPRATAFHIEGDRRQAGPLYARIGGEDIRVAEAVFAAWLIDEGQTIVYSAADGAGGYENEGQSLYRYEVRTRTKKKILSALYVIDQVTALTTTQGRQALLVEMRDGGLGASHLAVVDPRRGPVLLRQQVKLLSRKGDRIVLGRYREADWERMTTDTAVQPAETERYDVNTLLTRAAKQTTPSIP